MALIDKKKFSSLVDTAKQGVSEFVKSADIIASKEVAKTSESEDQIQTIDQLQESLVSFEGEMSPAMVQVLKSQIQVLGTISSPTMTGMMIDNLVLGLKQSLKEAEPSTISPIRESYTRLIQVRDKVPVPGWKDNLPHIRLQIQLLRPEEYLPAYIRPQPSTVS